MTRLYRFVDRHWVGVAALIALLSAAIMEIRLDISPILAQLAIDGTFVGLFGSLAGFLITGLTILLALSDHASLKEIAGTRAYSYIHCSLINAIWAQAAALIVSLTVQVMSIERGLAKIVWLNRALLIAVFIALAMLVVSVFFLSLIVSRVTRRPRRTSRT